MSDAPTITEAPAPEIHTVYDELVAAIQQHRSSFRTQRDDETDAAYVVRLLHAIADVSDPIYEALSPQAQQWFAQAAAAANAQGHPSPPEGFVTNYTPKQPKAKKKKLIERKPAKPDRTTSPTMGLLIRRAIINDRNISVQALENMLAANGFTDIKRSTVFSFQRGSLDTLKVAEAMGRFAWPAPAAPEQAA